MRWTNGIFILLWALSGCFFVISALNGDNSTKESGGIKAVGADGEVFCLDTLLGRSEIGLLVNGAAKADARDKGDTAGAVPAPSGSPCVNINSATEAQLVSIKGIGPVLAGNIVRHRQEKGAFRKKEDLLGVKGIGPAKLRQISEQVCF